MKKCFVFLSFLLIFGNQIVLGGENDKLIELKKELREEVQRLLAENENSKIGINILKIIELLDEHDREIFEIKTKFASSDLEKIKIQIGQHETDIKIIKTLIWLFGPVITILLGLIVARAFNITFPDRKNKKSIKNNDKKNKNYENNPK